MQLSIATHGGQRGAQSTSQRVGSDLMDRGEQPLAAAAADKGPHLSSLIGARVLLGGSQFGYSVGCSMDNTGIVATSELMERFMASDPVVRARIDGQVKEKAAKVLADMGLSVSDAIRLRLVRIAAEKALPFEIKVPNAETRTAMSGARTRSGPVVQQRG